ncbi:MAG: M24 family metallopeptidase [Alphaproteobacteria bacterium]
MEIAEYIETLQTKVGGTELTFPVAEFEARVAVARRAMAAADLDVLLVTHRPDLHYLAGYHTFGVGNHACLVLPREGAPSVQTTAMEIPSATAAGWIKDVHCAPWVGQMGAGGQLAKIVADKGLGGKRIGIQPQLSGLLPAILGQIEAGLPNATLVDASHLVTRLRLVKSPREMECMRKSAAYTEAGIRASYAVIAAGKTENDVARAGYDAMIAAGSEFMSVQPIATTGVRTGFSHQTYRRNPLKPGDPVFLEYGGCHLRYTAPLMRTAVIGQPSDAVRRVADAVLATLEAVIAAAKPGRTGHDVAMSGKKASASIAREAFLPGAYGYHVGVGFPPTWADGIGFLAEGNEDLLEPNMTFHTPLAFRVPGQFGVGISETLRITDSGCEPLTIMPRDLHVV